MKSAQIVGYWTSIDDDSCQGWDMVFEESGRGLLAFFNWCLCYYFDFSWDVKGEKIYFSEITRIERDSSPQEQPRGMLSIKESCDEKISFSHDELGSFIAPIDRSFRLLSKDTKKIRSKLLQEEDW